MRSLKIAIQPDKLLHKNGIVQSYSDIWFQAAIEFGHKPVYVDIYSNEFINHIRDYDAFMWRPSPTAQMQKIASKIITAIEQVAQIPCFFSSSMVRSFEDKIAQHYELKMAGIPTAKTWIFWSENEALEHCRNASYPLVLKLANGYQSSNVILLEDSKSAYYYIKQMFSSGLIHLDYRPANSFILFLRRVRQATRLLSGVYPNTPSEDADLQYGYFYIQEFLPKNEFDTRITIIGNRAFGFCRNNRPDDFRASGSGLIDFNPTSINMEAIKLAFEVAKKLKMPIVAIDLLKDGENYVVCEHNISFASWAVKKCPGYWELDKNTGTIKWIEEKTAPEKLIFCDFVNTVSPS